MPNTDKREEILSSSSLKTVEMERIRQQSEQLMYSQQQQQQVRRRRAPSTISLRCSSCQRLVTPCLVCAHVFPSASSPSPSSSLWEECQNCKVKNPLQDQHRKLLGIPPAFALPSFMVRRVLIAYIGRPASTIVTSFLHQQTKQVVAEAYSNISRGNRKHVDNKESFIHGGRHLLDLPFVLCEGVVTRVECPLDNNWVHRKEVHHNVIVGSEEESSISCITCGSCDSLCWKSCIVDDGNSALRRYEEQLVALHCPEALTRDMDQFTYPIYFDIWLTQEGKQKFKFEDMLMTVENFLSKQQELVKLKDSVLKATTAQKQVRIDSQALMSPASLHMLGQIFVDKVQERKEKFSSIAKPFSALLSQINLFLEFIYVWARDLSSHDPLVSAGVELSSRSMGKQYGVEDARETVKALFLLYHEVAHSTDVM